MTKNIAARIRLVTRRTFSLLVGAALELHVLATENTPLTPSLSPTIGRRG